MYSRVALILVAICCLADLSSSKGTDVEGLEKDLIEGLVTLAKEKGERVLKEKKEEKKQFFEEGVDKHHHGDSVRELHQLKLHSPVTKAKEENAIKSIAATKELMHLTGMTVHELQKSPEITSEWKRQNSCPTTNYTTMSCQSEGSFRTANGTCNNLKNPEWGAAGVSQRRYLDPVYGDGISSPRTLGQDGQDLRSARQVSNFLFKDTVEEREKKMSLMVMAWGQFLDHDITLTPHSSGEEGAQISCCDEAASNRDECFPIKIPKNDKHFISSCMEFVRSAASTDNNCTLAYREQVNAITAFVDGSNVYGSSLEETYGLRLFANGLLLESPGNLPPADSNDSCILSGPEDFCMKTGDVRANVIPHLGANHILFFREHNRVARELSVLNPSWSDERIFQEARKIIGALLQQITYYEWLPSILSTNFLEKYDLVQSTVDSYNASIDPSIKNGFAVAAMRFGHSLVPPSQAYLLHDYMTYDVKPIEENFLRPTMVISGDGKDVPKLVRWLCSNDSMKRDRILEKGVRDLLFLDSAGHSFDLGALNVQRGRDHGVPSYNEWRVWAGLSRAATFDNLTNHRSKDRKQLSKAYRHVDDIDLFAGGISERNVQGGNLGPTFSHILARQFSELKLGDRFWYERKKPEGFSKAQLDEIKKVKMAKVVCVNFGLDMVTKNIFNKVDERNPLVSCESLPGMNLGVWKSSSSTAKPSPSTRRPSSTTTRPPPSSRRPPQSTPRPPPSSRRPPRSTPRPPNPRPRPGGRRD